MAASLSFRTSVDPKDPHLKEVATFAVSEHNKKSGDNLKLQSIVKGYDENFGDFSQLKIYVTASDGPDNLETL
ncbi:unnamed protein product [Lupinus luteus]|uniref:Cystatin domain-containing protein n=1 Tax=Lupinus luteus TaxID=3873 RepID=A0AAV1W0K1_LUPLU